MKWFLLTAGIAIICAGCLTAADVARQDVNAKKLLDAQESLARVQKLYTELREDFLSGKLDIDIFTKKSLVVKDDIAALVDTVKTVKDDIVRQQNSSGSAWLTTLMAIGVNILVRGLPSKGPMGALINRVTPWRKDDR